MINGKLVPAFQPLLGPQRGGAGYPRPERVRASAREAGDILW